MGTQQLLIIVIGIILVGIAIAVGIVFFQDQSAATNRDELSNDLIHLAARAQKYYRTPSVMGGGSNSFCRMTLSYLTQNPSNPNGSYTLSPDPAPGGATSIVITGVGTETGVDGATPVEIEMTVWSDSVFLVMNN